MPEECIGGKACAVRCEGAPRALIRAVPRQVWAILQGTKGETPKGTPGVL